MMCCGAYSNYWCRFNTCKEIVSSWHTIDAFLYNVLCGGVFVSIVLSAKAGKWRITGTSGLNVLCTICSASSPSWMYTQLLIFAFYLNFSLVADFCQKVGVLVLLKLADYDIEWKHLYVASFTIDIMNHYMRKLLSVCIPLSHLLCFSDLLLYATLQ